MWQYLIGAGIGFGLAKLLQEDEKGKSNNSSSYSVKTENEEIFNAIYLQGVEWGFDNLTKKDFGSNVKAWNTFQKLKKDYKDFMSEVSKIKDEDTKEDIEAIIDKEGFDYALEGYAHPEYWKEEYNQDTLTTIAKRYVNNSRQFSKDLGVIE